MTHTTDAVARGRPGGESAAGARAGTLALRGIGRRFAGHEAVRDLSLEVAPGELLALLGASGSGKTTTLRMVAGYEKPDAGSIALDGRDITGLPPEKRGFGMVFQHYALFPHLTVEENVAFGLEARGVAKGERLAKAREALALVGLDGKGTRTVQALSGGEQQRVATARALVIQPRVLLLDEPLSNLDPTLRQSMREELRAILRRTHVTAMFVTHDQEDAFAVADRVALLEGGRLQQVGTPEELYHAPATASVARFIGRGALVPGRLAGGRVAITLGGVTREVPARAHDAAGASVLAVLRPEALAVVAAESASGDDGWPGEVIARRFAGSHYAWRVRLADGVEVEAEAPESGPCEGERVRVRVARGPVAVVGA